MVKNPVRFKLIAASMVFLFNPNLTIIDVLPDFLDTFYFRRSSAFRP